jgi:predicted Zn-dependent protease
MGQFDRAIESVSKALVIDMDNVAATIHLAQLFLRSVSSPDQTQVSDEVDIAAGMLDGFTRRAVGWDVPEAWYFLGKAAGAQRRRDKQRECLAEALRLEENKTIRSLKTVLPRCL